MRIEKQGFDRIVYFEDGQILRFGDSVSESYIQLMAPLLIKRSKSRRKCDGK